MAVVYDPLTGRSYSVPKAPTGAEVRSPGRLEGAMPLDSPEKQEPDRIWLFSYEKDEGLGVVLDQRA